MTEIRASISLLLVLLGASIPIIAFFLFIYAIKRMEHKQIMAAIEKGVPLPELKPLTISRRVSPSWIKSLTIGIAFLGFSLPFLFEFFEPLLCRNYVSKEQLMPGGLFFAIGISFFVRGLLLRKYQSQIPSENPRDNNAGKSEKA
jgi:hypothetical protein